MHDQFVIGVGGVEERKLTKSPNGRKSNEHLVTQVRTITGFSSHEVESINNAGVYFHDNKAVRSGL